MKKLALLVFALFALVLTNCGEDDVIPDKVVTATLSGAKEVPAVTTTAAGAVVGKYNKTTKVLTITVTYTGLSGAVTAGHIHKAAVGVNGSPVFAFTSLTSPIVYTSVALTTDQETDLLAGNYYVNLHTAANGGGEIRGQLSAK